MHQAVVTPFPAVGVLEHKVITFGQFENKPQKEKRIWSYRYNKHIQSSFLLTFLILLLRLTSKRRTEVYTTSLCIYTFPAKTLELFSFRRTSSLVVCVIDRVFYFFFSFFFFIDGVFVIDRDLDYALTAWLMKDYLWRVKSNNQIKCSHEIYFIFGPFGAPYYWARKALIVTPSATCKICCAFWSPFNFTTRIIKSLWLQCKAPGVTNGRSSVALASKARASKSNLDSI